MFLHLIALNTLALLLSLQAHAQYTPACKAKAPSAFSQEQKQTLCEYAINDVPARCAVVLVEQRRNSGVMINNDTIVDHCRKQKGIRLIKADHTPGDIAAEFTETETPNESASPCLNETNHYEINFVAGDIATGWLSQAAAFQSKLTNMFVSGVEAGRTFYTRKYLEMAVRAGIYGFTSANHGPNEINVNLSYAICFKIPQAADLKFCASEGLSYFPSDVPYIEKLNASTNSPVQGTAKLLNYLTFRLGVDVTPSWAIGVGINHRSGAGAFWAASPFKSDQGNGINLPLTDNPHTAVGDASNQYVIYSSFYLKDLAFWKYLRRRNP